MIKTIIIITSALLHIALSAQTGDDKKLPHNILRESLEVPAQTLPDLDDQAMLEVVEMAARLAGAEQKKSFDISFFKNDLHFTFHGATGNQKTYILCHFHGTKPHCSDPVQNAELLLNTFGHPLHKVNISLDKLYQYDLSNEKQLNALDYASYGTALVFTYYGVKKIFNKLMTGKWANHGHQHSHFFLSKDAMERETTRLTYALHSLGSSFQNINTSTDINKVMDNIAEDIFQVGLQIVRKASSGCHHGSCSGHNHSHGHHHHSKPHDQQAKASLFDSYRKFAVNMATDFHKEVIAPVVHGLKTIQNPFHRQQLKDYLELATMRTIQERGVTSAIVSGTFIVVGQAGVETLESLLMPGGVHLYCHVGNALVLAAASTVYAGQFCLRNLNRLEGLTFKQRLKIFTQNIKLPYRGRGLNDRSPEAFKHLTNDDQVYLGLKLTHMNIAKKLNYARTLGLVNKEDSRTMAKQLGKMQNEMDLIGLDLKAIKHHNDLQKSQATFAHISSWYQRSMALQNQIPDPETSATGKSKCPSFLSQFLK